MFPQTNMLHARVFPILMLFTVWSLWAYWRNALHPCPPGRRAQICLLTGVTGLLYSQYFGALLLPVLGLFHLLFVPKNRRWWRTVLLLGLAACWHLCRISVARFVRWHRTHRDQRARCTV